MVHTYCLTISINSPFSTQNKMNFMSYIFKFSKVLAFICLCNLNLLCAYDDFEGTGHNLICFEEQEFSECNSSIPQVFTPRDKGVNLNDRITKFLLYTRRNTEKPEPLHKCGGRTPTNSSYRSTKKTVIIAHGYSDGVCHTAWQREMKNQLLQRSDYNVILIDWTWGNYVGFDGAFENTKVVGEQTAFVIKRLMGQHGITAHKFHIIGNSFGVNIASFAGKNVKNLRRLTALDPVFLVVENAPPSQILTKTDAVFVDVLHTAVGDCAPYGVGDGRSSGHQDFFPNGGVEQPSCYTEILPDYLKLNIFYATASLIYQDLCYHLQSIQFFKASINPGRDRFYAAKCSSYENYKAGRCPYTRKSCAVMGMDSERYYYKHGQVQGDYYLDTELTCPYIKNCTGIGVQNSCRSCLN